MTFNKRLLPIAVLAASMTVVASEIKNDWSGDSTDSRGEYSRY